MHKATKRVMAYICMPLLFLLVGYGLAALALSPYLRMGASMAKLVVANATPTFTGQLDTIFNPPAPGEQPPQGDTVDISVVEIPKRETQYAQLECTALELSVPLYYGDTDLVLDNGAGTYAGGYLPGFGGTILVAGHNQTYFNCFQNAAVGNVFTLTTNYGVYEYEVYAVEVRRYDDDEAFDLGQTERELLVAYTCYPFTRFAGFTEERLFLYAEKISGPEVTRDGQ